MAMGILAGKRVLAFTEDEFEDLEMWYPVLCLRESGAEVIVAGSKAKHIYTGKYGMPLVSDISFDEANEEAFDGLYVPGGWAPDKLRRYDSVLSLTKMFHESRKPIARRPPDLPAFTLAFVELLAGGVR